MVAAFKSTFAVAAITTFASMVFGGCAGEWSDQSYATADYKTTYKKITDKCEQSNSHGNKYVVTYINPVGHEAWKSGQPLPKNSVLIKVGHADSSCADVTEHWTMKKVAETGTIKDWNWQTLDEYGDITQSDQSLLGGCAGCHTSYKASDFVGTPAPATGS